ncbi:MAG: cytochrome c1 [Alphaproteobacteria bacterium]|nr:cytochrome c1 [Alphaproteobacteria bacterium]
MKKSSLFIAVSLVTLSLAAGAVASSSGQKAPKQVQWAFDGVFGRVDKQSAQRGLQVYKEVCAACHGLKRVAFRNLTEIGFSEAEVKALAATYQIKDGPNDDGDMFERAGVASDYFPSPYANDNAAKAVQNGAVPPDLSLIIKARPDGANYLFSLLTGYEAAPADAHLAAGQHYNPYFAGGVLAMPAPLSDGQVEYSDGTKATTEQMAKDVVNFLQWAAEPEMEARKQTGLKVMLFLFVFTAFAYIAKRNIWRKLH